MAKIYLNDNFSRLVVTEEIVPVECMCVKEGTFRNKVTSAEVDVTCSLERYTITSTCEGKCLVEIYGTACFKNIPGITYESVEFKLPIPKRVCNELVEGPVTITNNILVDYTITPFSDEYVNLEITTADEIVTSSKLSYYFSYLTY